MGYPSIEIYWRGELAGYMLDAMPDMWYLEGVWKPLTSDYGAKFVDRVSGLNAREVYFDHTKGVRIKLRDQEGAGFTEAIVISLAEGRLFVRRVFDSEAVSWINENVPE